MPLPRRGRSRQRGFSLLVVFLLLSVMVGVAAMLLLTAQTDLQVTGQDREASTAFYAAESAVAFAKDFLTTQAPPVGPSPWSALLQSNQVQLCQPCNFNVPACAVVGSEPGVVPRANQPWVAYDLNAPAQTFFRFCVHNNALDSTYTLVANAGDTVDGDGILAVEAYGRGPGGSISRITVEVQAATGNSAVGGRAMRTGNAAGNAGGGSAVANSQGSF